MTTPLVLDPTEVADSRIELDLNSGAIRVGKEGPDWGEAAIAAFMAEQALGESPVDFRLPNRQITIPLSVGAAGAAGHEAALRDLTAKVALIQREGGWLKRGDGLYADVVNAALTVPDHHHHLGLQDDILLKLEAIPDFYGDEITLDLITETTLSEIAAKLKQGGADAVIQGDHPARCRIVVNELDGDSQLGLIWGLRCRHYSAAATAKLAYEAEALDPLDTASIGTVGGLSVVQHTSLATTWTPVLGTNIGGTTFLTHTGSYRVMARAYSFDGPQVALRLVWDSGDFTAGPSENDEWRFPNASPVTSAFTIADLGTIRLDKAPTGAHRWQGQIQARGTNGGEAFYIDRIWLVPLDEGSGTLRAANDIPAGGFADFLAHDPFNHAVGALAGKTAPVGGTWASSFGVSVVEWTASGSGYVKREGLADGPESSWGGAFAVLPASHGPVVVEADIGNDFWYDVTVGIVARYIDFSNFVYAGFFAAPNGNFGVALWKRVAGAASLLWPGPYDTYPTFEIGEIATIRMQIDGSGRLWLWCGLRGSKPRLLTVRQDNETFTGNVLGTGKVGLYHRQNGGATRTGTVLDFRAFTPPLDAVMYASQSAELRTDGMYRENAAGTAYGPMAEVLGDLPRLPPSGMEGRPVEVFAKASRGDLDRLPDQGIDDASLQVIYRPSWLLPPGPA